MGTAAIAAASIGASTVGGIFQARAAERGAELQSEAAQQQIQLQERLFGQATERLDPYITGGQDAYQQQLALSGAQGAEAQQAAYQQFVESPATQFLRQQGEQAINRQASATGTLGGSSRLQALSQFNQNLAQQSIGQYFSRLGAVSGVGLGAAQSLTGAGGQYGAAAGQALQQQGLAQAQGQIGQANAYAGGLQNLAALLALYGRGGGTGGESGV